MPGRRGLSLLLAVLGLVATGVRADGDRPRIGLVLSGGGARGTAHAGVLQILEEQRVPVDFVVGTSMGSIVGGLYASGLSPDRLEEELTTTDWTSALTNQPPRTVLSFRRREDTRDYQFRGSLRLVDRRLQVPSGAIDGHHILFLLRSLTLPVSTVDDFDELPLPFRAVASDINTGRRVVLESGDLARAMRASMSVPGVFAPIEIEGNLLVDGGITDNLPIDVARSFEPDILIAVDVSETLHPLDSESSVLSVFNQMITIMMARETERVVDSLDEDDLLIVPDLEGLSSADFSRSADGIAAGRRAALAAVDRLSELSVSPEEYARYRRRIERPRFPDSTVAELEIVVPEGIDPESVRSTLRTTEDGPLDLEALAQDLDHLTSLDRFASADFHIEPRSGDTVALRIETESPRGRSDILRFHLALADDFQGGTAFGFGARYTATRLNRRGLELRLDTLLGDEQFLQAELYHPWAGSFFVAPAAGFRANDLPIFDDGRELATYRLEGFDAQLDLGMHLGRWGELRLGYSLWSGSAEPRVAGPSSLTVDFEDRIARLLLRVDTQDRPSFSSSGTYLEASLTRQFEGLFFDAPADYAELRWNQAYRFGRYQLGTLVEAGTLLDDEAQYYPFELGGFRRLSSLDRQELIGNQKLLLTVDAKREI